MYLHCRFGFFEIDRWDGSPLPLATHRRIVESVRGPVFVVRSRRRSSLLSLTHGALPAQDRPKVMTSPEGWDYPFRTYVSEGQLSAIMALVTSTLTYRNFKSVCDEHEWQEGPLAHDIWQAAYDRAPRRS